MTLFLSYTGGNVLFFTLYSFPQDRGSTAIGKEQGLPFCVLKFASTVKFSIKDRGNAL